jgi:hypothetical protein
MTLLNHEHRRTTRWLSAHIAHLALATGVLIALLMPQAAPAATDPQSLGEECAAIWAQTWPSHYEPEVESAELKMSGTQLLATGFATHEPTGQQFPYSFYCALSAGKIDRIKSYLSMRHDQRLAKDGRRPLSGNPVLPELSK